MRGSNKIHHRPYLPATRLGELKHPYICRLAPFSDGFELEWLPASDGEHNLFYCERGKKAYTKVLLESTTVKIENLETETEYEFYIEDNKGLRSNVRLVRTCETPDGTIVVNYLHPEDKQYEFSGKYLCSPSLVRLEDGTLVAGMDLFGPLMAQTLTVLFSSKDDGKTWRYLTDLHPFYWGSLFLHKGKLYMMGLTTEYGNLQLTCSEDGGKTWATPITLFYGSNVRCETNGGMHRAPMQVVNYNGRLYTTCEYGCWWKPCTHLPSVISIDENDDLMVPENWYSTGYLPFEGKWKKDAGIQGDTIEGNIVIAPDGNMYNIMRWKIGEYLKLQVDTENHENPLEYKGIYKAPTTNSMFRVIPYKGKYLFIANRQTENAAKVEYFTYRNVLSLYITEDLENFKFVKDIINYDHVSPKIAGFQYPVVIKEADGISLMIRSAFNNPNDCHNSNYMLYTKITDDELTAGF